MCGGWTRIKKNALHVRGTQFQRVRSTQKMGCNRVTSAREKSIGRVPETMTCVSPKNPCAQLLHYGERSQIHRASSLSLARLDFTIAWQNCCLKVHPLLPLCVSNQLPLIFLFLCSKQPLSVGEHM